MSRSVITSNCQTLICQHFFQNKAKLRVLNFGWLFNRGKDNRKPSLGQPKHGHGCFIGVSFTVFTVTENNFRALISGHLIGGDGLIGV